MKRILSLLLLTFLSSVALFSNNTGTLEDRVKRVQENQLKYENDMRQLKVVTENAQMQIRNLKSENTTLKILIDSLKSKYEELGAIQTNDRQTLSGKIETTNQSVQTNESTLKSRTLWGAGIAAVLLCLLAALAAIANTMRKKIKRGSDSIDDVRKAQDALQTAQKNLQEESVKLDSRLLELVDKQLSNQQSQNVQVSNNKSEVDHSLAQKVADEIVRIELNLSRMDSSVKGHKQLSKAVERIKNNFMAQGYEIVDMLGKPYNDGMKAVASFVPDESLNEGEQIITGITKPQINYKGVMIQAAQITVSQNI